MVALIVTLDTVAEPVRSMAVPMVDAARSTDVRTAALALNTGALKVEGCDTILKKWITPLKN